MKELKPYSEYRDSGVESIGYIPKSWTISKIKYLSNEKLIYGAIESAYMDDRSLPRYIRITDIDKSGLLKEDTYKSLHEKIASKYPVRYGDILFARSGASVGKTYIHQTNQKACYAGYLIKYSSDVNKLNPKFLYYFTNTLPYEEWIQENTIQATIENVSAEKYANLQIPYPSRNQQNNIVNFLDNKTSEIDSLISDKERLIDLLEEKRQAVITETVTKGLDPDVKMKDSGIEWIGEIPEHWDLESIKYHSTLNKKVLPESTHPDTEIHYIDIGSVNSKGEISNVEKMKFKEAPSRARRILSENDTVISTVRTYLRAITTIEEVKENKLLIGSTGFAVLSPNKAVNKDYFSYIFQTTYYIDGIVSMSKGVSYPAINAADIIRMKIILPSIEEQKLIVAKIRKELKELNGLQFDLLTQIQKLKEYRESLIYEAVTGKIDVRDYVTETEEVY